MSWNATGIRTGLPYLLNELNCKNISICGIAEHFLLKQNAHVLKNCHNQYHSHIVTSESPYRSTITGRLHGRGGVALMWHSSLNEVVQIVPTNSDRVAAIKIKCKTKSIYVLQVYLPCSNDLLESYKYECDKLHDLLSSFDADSQVIVMGDYNTRVVNQNDLQNEQRTLNSRSVYISRLLGNHCLKVITDTHLCKGDYSFVPGTQCTPTFIDHIAVDESSVSCIQSCYVGTDAPLNVSRHLPLFLSIDIEDNVYDSMKWSAQPHTRLRLKWTSTEQIQRYNDTLTSMLSSSQTDYNNVNETYALIVNCINIAANKHISKQTFKPYLKPYWSPVVKQLHKNMTYARNQWLSHGRPREGPIYDKYKNEKRIFRCKLRNAADEYERAEYERIEKLSELDQTGFWKMINSRKKKHMSGANNKKEMQFGRKRVNNPEEELNCWREYFENLYQFSSNDDYDNTFRLKVEQELENFLSMENNYISSYITSPMTLDEMALIIKSLPCGKSPSSDNITYEHIKHGGLKLQECLVNLFNSIMKSGNIPRQFKDSITITLHKGQGRSKANPNNYRAISLLPSISKLFEKVILDRIETLKLPSKLHPLQHGFQKRKSCKMASFIYQELSHYCYERHSTMYSCFMDAYKAFDSTWIKGLLFKLFKLGIQGSALKLFDNMLNGASSRVWAYGHLSEPFYLQQGTRQGSICSPFLYTVFIDELLCMLNASGHGLSIYDLNLCCPTQADDIVLTSLSESGLQELLNICKQYADKWRYTYNASKCAILIHNQTNKRKACRQFSYGNTKLTEVSQYKHLGITQHHSGKSPANVDDVRQAARGTLFSFYSTDLNPLTGAKLYTSTVLPRAYFGCELWNNISKTDMRNLETTHHICLKRIQKLPMLTRSDMVTGLLGFSSIEAYIDLQKLAFLGTLCRLRSTDYAYRLFITRLYQFKNSETHKHRGFIKDIHDILDKYNIHLYLNQFMNDNSFPDKSRWKIIIKREILQFEREAWLKRIHDSDDFKRFRQIQHTPHPAAVWRTARDRSNTLDLMTFAARQLCLPTGNPSQCVKCMVTTYDILYHSMFECDPSVTIPIYSKYIKSIDEQISTRLTDYLASVPDDRKLLYMLGRIDRHLTTLISPDKFPKFIQLSAQFLRLCCISS